MDPRQVPLSCPQAPPCTGLPGPPARPTVTLSALAWSCRGVKSQTALRYSGLPSGTAAPPPPSPLTATVAPSSAARRELAQYEAQESAASQQSEVEEAVVGGYRVIRTLGRGAFGVVLLGQRDDGELAAIKMLPRGDRVRAAAHCRGRGSAARGLWVACVHGRLLARCLRCLHRASASRLACIAPLIVAPACAACTAQVRQYRTYVAREILHHASLRHPFIVGVKEVMLTEKVRLVYQAAAAAAAADGCSRHKRNHPTPLLCSLLALPAVAVHSNGVCGGGHRAGAPDCATPRATPLRGRGALDVPAAGDRPGLLPRPGGWVEGGWMVWCGAAQEGGQARCPSGWERG